MGQVKVFQIFMIDNIHYVYGGKMQIGLLLRLIQGIAKVVIKLFSCSYKSESLRVTNAYKVK